MHFTFCILGQFDGVYRCPMDAILEGGLIHFKKDFLCMAARCWGCRAQKKTSWLMRAGKKLISYACLHQPLAT